MGAPSYYDEYLFLSDVSREIGRLRNLSELMWPKERRNLLGFGLQDGMSVLELGSGPGFFTEQLAKLVPKGSITCIEPERSLLEHAREHLKDKAMCRYEILETTGEAMDLPEGSFDFAVARALFQHLRDPELVARKILRCLKPGGRLVITDFDIEIPPVTWPSFPEIQPIMAKSLKAQIQRGVDPASFTVGRRLWNILKKSGFTELDLDSVVFHSGDEGVKSCYPQFAPVRMEPLVKAGAITQDELDIVKSAVERSLGTPDAFYLRVALMACGNKPSA